MGRATRTVRAGEKQLFVEATTGSSVATIPNFGVSRITTTAAETFVLGAPEQGVEKTILVNSPTSAAITVRLSTGTSVTVGSTAATQITFNATADACVKLVGVSSVAWSVASVYPDNVAANSTGTVIGTS